MFLMDKEASNGPRARVEVLVGTPGCHIHSPVMEVKLNVTSSMGQVKTNIATLRKGREREGGRKWGRGGEGERKGEREGREREGGREGREKGGEGRREKERDVDTRRRGEKEKEREGGTRRWHTAFIMLTMHT